MSASDPIAAALAAVLAPLVREAVSAALAEHSTAEAPEPALLDRARLARALDVSTCTVDRMRERGQLPSPVMCGDSPRWELAVVLEHLRGRS